MEPENATRQWSGRRAIRAKAEGRFSEGAPGRNALQTIADSVAGNISVTGAASRAHPALLLHDFVHGLKQAPRSADDPDLLFQRLRIRIILQHEAKETRWVRSAF